MCRFLKNIRNFYWRNWPFWLRPGELLYSFKCWAWYRYTTVKPKTLPFHTWTDRDNLLIHCSFQILDDFIQKELDGYKPEDWAYYYTDRQDDLVEFGDIKRDPYFVLNWINEWFKLVYLEKEDSNYSKWYKFTKENSKIKEGSELNPGINWTCEEGRQNGIKILNRSWKKEIALDKQLEENLILLVRLRKFLWT